MNLEFLGLDLHWIWLILAALLAGAEIVAPGVFLIFLALAAVLTGVTAALGLPLLFQLALFPLFALGSVYAGKRWYSRNPVKSSDPLLNDRIGRYIGQTVTVVSPIENGSGRVKLGDGVWTAKGPDAEAGAKVKIVGADGTCLKVEPLPMIEEQ